MDDNSTAQRAAERRQRMQVRVYQSLAAHERDDAAYWLALPVADRVLQVWKLSEEQWRLGGARPHEPGLCRSIARVLRGRTKDLGDIESLGARAEE